MKKRIGLQLLLPVVLILALCTSVPCGAAGKIKLLEPGVKNPDVDFSGIEISAIHDAFAGKILEWYAPLLKKECGVTIGKTEMVDIPKLREKAIGDLIGGKPTWQLVEITPNFLADFVLTGKIEPLDKYFEKYDDGQIKAYFDDILDPYKEFYMKWGGKLWAIPFDGDVHLFNYRKSYFQNPEYKQKYQAKYGKELAPPETWDDYMNLCKFFGEVLPPGVWPTMYWGMPPWSWAFYFNIAASRGVNYFDKEMEHALWPREEAIAALKWQVDTVPYCPPGVATFGNETVDYWLAGKVVMQIWWIDINEWGQMGTPKVKGDVANALIPGYKDPKTGEVIHRAMMPYNRVWVIPKDLPEKVKEAAFYVGLHVSHSQYSFYSTPDLLCGMDPYMYSHYTDENAKQYNKPNPLRGTAPDWETNDPCFPTFEEARQHLDGGLANMKVGFPQPNFPGVTEYTESLCRWVQKALAKEVPPEEAINKAAAEWEEIRDRLGKDKQKKYWKEFYDSGIRLGYWK